MGHVHAAGREVERVLSHALEHVHGCLLLSHAFQHHTAAVRQEYVVGVLPQRALEHFGGETEVVARLLRLGQLEVDVHLEEIQIEVVNVTACQVRPRDQSHCVLEAAQLHECLREEAQRVRVAAGHVGEKSLRLLQELESTNAAAPTPAFSWLSKSVHSCCRRADASSHRLWRTSCLHSRSSHS